jgi:hypothetical protein
MNEANHHVHVQVIIDDEDSVDNVPLITTSATQGLTRNWSNNRTMMVHVLKDLLHHLQHVITIRATTMGTATIVIMTDSKHKIKSQ